MNVSVLIQPCRGVKRKAKLQRTWGKIKLKIKVKLKATGEATL